MGSGSPPMLLKLCGPCLWLCHRKAQAQGNFWPFPGPRCPVPLGTCASLPGSPWMAPAALSGELSTAFVRTDGGDKDRHAEMRHTLSLSLPHAAFLPQGSCRLAWGRTGCHSRRSKAQGGQVPLAHSSNCSGWLLFLLIYFQLALGSPAWV